MTRKQRMEALARRLIEELSDSGEDNYIYEENLQNPKWRALSTTERVVVGVIIFDRNDNPIPATKTAGLLPKQSTDQASKACPCCGRAKS